jgi:hypothetical protein
MSDKHKRRWYQFSLWRLMIALTLTSVALGSLSVLCFRVASRRRAVVDIKAMGGMVEYDFEWEGAKTPTGFAVDVGRVLGDEYAFSEVSMVAFGGRDASAFGDGQLSLFFHWLIGQCHPVAGDFVRRSEGQ